ncbi:hypothetical protein SAMN05720354_10262 [Nitrosospira sp. Nsp1]|nr:hypothetical protein SAMN05720354_10262 [Nitrosospira sp. Nsp1]
MLRMSGLPRLNKNSGANIVAGHAAQIKIKAREPVYEEHYADRERNRISVSDY